MLPDALTVRQFSAVSSLSQAEIQQAIRDAIAADPTLVIRTVENLSVIPVPYKEDQLAFIDSQFNPELNGSYGYELDRGWKRLRSIN